MQSKETKENPRQEDHVSQEEPGHVRLHISVNLDQCRPGTVAAVDKLMLDLKEAFIAACSAVGENLQVTTTKNEVVLAGEVKTDGD